MKHELELKVQAWLDGELSGREAARIADWVARDSEAGAMAAELGAIRKAMAHSELIVPLPESREFHWSKIERQIRQESFAANRPAVSWLIRWRRFLAPVAGVAALGCVLTLAVQQTPRPTFDEISSVDDSMEAVTFHDQSAGMTVVWLGDSSQTSETSQPAKTTVPDDVDSDVERD